MGHSLDLEKLTKILALTTSSSEGEALAAARKAASLIERAGLTYSTLFFEHLGPGRGRVGAGSSTKMSRTELEARIQRLQAEVAALRQQLGAVAPSRALPSERLRRQLLASAPLNSWERTALDGIAAIRPKSREEYFVLWLARRYCVNG
jgi:hypothetical protein